MRYLIILLGVVCLALPACAPPPEPEPEAAPEPVFDQAAEEAAIREASKQSIESDNNRDIEAHLAVYADSVISFQSKTDRAAHKKVHTDAWARQKDFNLKLLDEIDVVFLSPDVAIHRYSQEATGRLDEDGSPLPPRKQAIARVYVKKGGKWLAVARFPMDIEE